MTTLLDAYVTPSQAAHLLGVSRQLINDWRARGRIKPNADGLYRYGDVAEVDYEARHTQHPGAWQRGQQPCHAR